MICSLLAYDAQGNVIAVRDRDVVRNAAGDVIGLVDYAAHEAAGGEHTDFWSPRGWSVDGATGAIFDEWTAKGSKVWPEWLGGRALEFRVELEGPPGRKRIAALVHRTSGHRRERAAIEAAIAAAPEMDLADGTIARDLRAIVGGPDRPLHLDEDGRTIGPDHPAAPRGTPAHIPMIGGRPR